MNQGQASNIGPALFVSEALYLSLGSGCCELLLVFGADVLRGE